MAEEQEKPDTKQEVKYVLSGQTTGLGALAQNFREYDLEKIQHCKEDIDTFLVFVSS